MVNQSELLHLRQIAPSVWGTICRQVDGVAVSSTISALHRKGLLEWLLINGPVSLAQILKKFGGNEGYLHIALRILACQSWLHREGPAGTPKMTVELSEEGKTMAQFAHTYTTIAQTLPFIRQFLQDWHLGNKAKTQSGLRQLTTIIQKAQHQIATNAPAHLAHKFNDHIQGHLAVPIMAMLSHQGLFPPQHEVITTISLEQYNGQSAILNAAFEALGLLEWAKVQDGKVQFSPEGKVAVAFARQYWYPISYLETLIRVPRLLFGQPAHFHTTSGEEETHVNRLLDIQFSGAVFETSCQKPFLDMALPLFNTSDLASQPKAIVDMGCGNGALLEVFYEAIQQQSLRGLHLDEFPLLMIGVEPSAVARKTTSQKLQAAGIPCRIIAGNIAAPETLRQSLEELGVLPHEALHVSKSVIHNRPYLPPNPATPPLAIPSTGAFATPAGEAIPNTQMGQNLVEHFAKWKPLCQGHGMLVIEGHCAPPSLIAQLNGRSISTIMEATHGYSNQYLVEPEVFRAAAAAAGFRARQSYDIGKESVGHTLLTIDYFVVD